MSILESFDKLMIAYDEAWAEDGKLAALDHEPTQRHLDFVRDLFRRADNLRAELRTALAKMDDKVSKEEVRDERD